MAQARGHYCAGNMPSSNETPTPAEATQASVEATQVVVEETQHGTPHATEWVHDSPPDALPSYNYDPNNFGRAPTMSTLLYQQQPAPASGPNAPPLDSAPPAHPPVPAEAQGSSAETPTPATVAQHVATTSSTTAPATSTPAASVPVPTPAPTLLDNTQPAPAAAVTLQQQAAPSPASVTPVPAIQPPVPAGQLGHVEHLDDGLEVDDSVSQAAPPSTSDGGNPYWKLLGPICALLLHDCQTCCYTTAKKGAVQPSTFGRPLFLYLRRYCLGPLGSLWDPVGLNINMPYSGAKASPLLQAKGWWAIEMLPGGFEDVERSDTTYFGRAVSRYNSCALKAMVSR